MKLAVAYMRMSTDKQEYSLESQLRLIKEFAYKNDYFLKNTYIDEGISGKTVQKRPAFLKMIEDSFSHLFDYILIYDSSRFARNLEQSLVYKSILKKNGVCLISITEPAFDDDISLITDALLGAMNEMYIRKLSKNVKRGMEQKVLRGEFFGNIPYGYEYSSINKNIVIHKKQADIIQYLFNETKKGRSAFSLACELKEKNITTKNGLSFDSRRINYILSNPTYKGYLHYTIGEKNFYQKAKHAAIIDEKLFDEVQQIKKETSLKSHQKVRPSESQKHWLSGLLKCSNCNCSYIYSAGHNGRKDRFRCGGQSKGICKNVPSFTVEAVEKKLLDILDKITENYFESFSINNSPSYINYNKEIKKYREKLKRIKKAYITGVDTLKEYNENKSKIIEKINQLEKEKNTFPYSKIKIESISSFLSSGLDSSKKNEFLKKILEKIVIDNETHTFSFYFYDE